MQVERCNYLVSTNSPKTNGQKLTPSDLMNVGYMAGRYGISLDGNLTKNQKPKYTDKGTIININSCTKELFEKNLNESGIKFNVIA